MGELVAALGRGPLEPDIGRSRRLVHAHAVTQQDGHAWDIALADAPSLRLEDLRDERIALADDRDAPGYNRGVTDAFARACVAPAFSDRAAGATAWERAIDGGCAGLSSACDIHARSASVRLVPLRDDVRFPLYLLTASQRPVVLAFAAAAREAFRSGVRGGFDVRAAHALP